MQNYIIEYDIAAIILSSIILICFLSRKTIKTTATKLFTIILALLVVSSVLNLITVKTQYSPIIPVWLNYILFISYYNVANSLSPFAYYFVSYSAALQKSRKMYLFSSRIRKILYIPLILNYLIIISTPFTRAVFYFSPDGSYHYGALLIFPYIVSSLYLVFTLIAVILFHSQLLKRQLFSIIFYVSAAFLTAVLQFTVKNLLIVEFISSISILLIYLSLENPASYRDKATYLYNSKAFSTILTSYLESKEKKFRIIGFQIVGLKYLNESIGNDKKNTVILQIKNIVKEISTGNQVFRLSNSRFAIIIPDNENLQNTIVQNLKQIFSESFYIDDYPLSISVRIVTLNCPDDGDTIEDIIDLINNSLHSLIEAEAGSHRAADKSIISKKERENKILIMLRNAVMKKQFYIVYQPIFSLKENRFTTAEALVRLKNEELGSLSPEEFIPIAEKNGMVLEIGDFVFKNVCKFLANERPWEKGIEYIHINFSVIQCMQEVLSQKLFAIMDSYNLNYKHIKLEITETSAVISDKTLRSNMNKLIQKNIQFVLDDFGTGFSNTYSLIQYPFSTIKIDKSVIDAALSDEKSKLILQHTINMIKKLNMDVIAEGVETEEALSLLKKMGCDYIQGFYYSKPLKYADFLELLNTND